MAAKKGSRVPGPVILPFVHPEPEPLARVGRTWIIDRPMVVQLIGERWYIGDVPHVPYDCVPDPLIPEFAFSINLIDYKAQEVMPEASAEEAYAFLRSRF